jgi:integrase
MDRDHYALKQNRLGIWGVHWREDGHRRSVSTGTRDRAEAETYRARLIAGAMAPRISGPTIAHILEAYLDARRDRASYKSMVCIARLLSDYFGPLEPNMVTQPLVNAFARKREADGRSGSTIATDLITLRSAVTYCRKQRMTDQEVLFEMPVRRSPPRDRWLTKDECQRLIASCLAPHLRLFVLIALMTGARREAVLDLTWDRVDMAARRIDFGPGNGNKRRAVVPVNATLYAALVDANGVRTSPHVVEFGGHRITDVRTGLRAACKRAGISPTVKPHELRHTAATHLAMSGTPMREACRMLGMTEATFEKVYGKHHPNWLKQAAQALDLQAAEKTASLDETSLQPTTTLLPFTVNESGTTRRKRRFTCRKPVDTV